MTEKEQILLKLGEIIYCKVAATKSSQDILEIEAEEGFDLVGLYIGVIQENGRPELKQVTEAMNSIGWFNGQQLIEFFGSQKAEAFRLHIQSLDLKPANSGMN